MSQEFCVLSCFTCKAFQVQIVKKSSNKWNCKVCNQKQSVVKVFAQGGSAECREVVQQLNLVRGETELQENYKTLAKITQEEELSGNQQESVSVLGRKSEDHVDLQSDHEANRNTSLPIKHPVGVVSVAEEESKWKIFLEPEDY